MHRRTVCWFQEVAVQFFLIQNIIHRFFSEYPLSKMHPQNYQIYELKEVHIFSNIALYEIDCNTVTCPGFFVGGVPESYGALQAECSSFASVVSLPKPAMAGEWSLAKRGAGKRHGEKVVATQLFLSNQALYTLGK